MSWPAELMEGRLRAVAILLAAVTLGGCGFTPLYGTLGVSGGLSSIKVNVPQGRTAFLLGEDLDDAFGRDRDKAAVYRLDISLLEKRYPRGLRVDNTADRYEAHLVVSYQLVEMGTGKVLKAGSEPTHQAFNSPALSSADSAFSIGSVVFAS